ncbi:MAG: ATP-binding cassette domain-containing protein [Clostridiaceae bacterium]|nr:ATP-binding cassette domain-containing protein [Clostridiaceae bacterium]
MDREDKDVMLKVEHLGMEFISGRRHQRNLVKAVDDISFEVRRSETFGLVGESGCGKTTTGRCLIRLYNPTSGSIKLEGRELTGRMDKEKRRYITDRVSMIFQDPIESLNPRMTILEIIGEGLRVRGIKDKDEIQKRVYDILDKVGLTREHASRYPHEFSGGQRQRIGIARAIIINPSMVIADEPVSALDVSVQAQVINLLNDLKEELGLTILFIAHNLSVVKYFSDRVGVMYKGKLLEVANASEIYSKPLHPYTKSLLSAIPEPNPITERYRERFSYDPSMHDYTNEKPSMTEVFPEHFVYASPSEIEAIRNAEAKSL